MDKEKVESIIESKGYIEVTYNNKPVWIEYINKDGKAQVKDLDTDEIKEASFEDLHESYKSDEPDG